MKSLTLSEFAAVYGPLPDCPEYPSGEVYTSGIDLAALLCLARNATGILEFGTARGQTTLALARFCPVAQIVTVDVPQKLVAAGTFQECDLRPMGDVGAAFRGEPESERIRQVWADPGEPYNLEAFGACDFAFIDGWHTHEGVWADTRAAAALMLRGSGRGTLVWDDYLSAGVPVFLEQLNALVTGLTHIAGTRLVFLEADELSCELSMPTRAAAQHRLAGRGCCGWRLPRARL